MKTLLIMRHGEAGPMQADDAARLLTDRGRAQAFEMGQWLLETHAPQAVLVSPYTRAQQTALEVKQSNHFVFEETCTDIVPSGSASFAVDYIETLISMNEEIDSWLIVAHMPIVSYMVDQLVPGEMPIFATASVAVLKYDPDTHKASYVGLHSPSI
ncbi:phosphohistidine phosphatase SixA [Pseudoalteromonas luteoviolacea]|uniref:Phosphohistidine phosphatase SixA n=1 Tax=Pseudoalteromonas luteoviolacea TaxID=43657 RepID=A0A1C0TNN5_9GAMM|nr:phosphohistidine phosphatase SixA [Pseudoalteromonas luteoviolacea]MBQ4813053.1 phosphohistidine phosphatase SixA [Pseudoalteromonas luteoviolacea]OCQ20425.1 phosphohistidine phosphatase SixA [Pseudoalteromonas luteoviolacea]